jgi:hypothetical protein
MGPADADAGGAAEGAGGTSALAVAIATLGAGGASDSAAGSADDESSTDGAVVRCRALQNSPAPIAKARSATIHGVRLFAGSG